jgi:hypothetical protein
MKNEKLNEIPLSYATLPRVSFLSRFLIKFISFSRKEKKQKFVYGLQIKHFKKIIYFNDISEPQLRGKENLQ